jgi:hypothetical protein
LNKLYTDSQLAGNKGLCSKAELYNCLGMPKIKNDKVKGAGDANTVMMILVA